MEINVQQLVTDITSAVSAIVNKDASTIRGFSTRQLNGMANQASLVATGIRAGSIDEEDRVFFLDQLLEMAHNFARSLVGLILITVEKAWNAIVEVLWKAISAVIGSALPKPNIV